MKVNWYVDEDFLGLYGYDDTSYTMCTNSRTWYIITFYECPLLFLSKLQKKVALLTLHSKYVELSQYLRGFIPLKNITKEVIGSLNLDVSNIKFVSKSTVY